MGFVNERFRYYTFREFASPASLQLKRRRILPQLQPNNYYVMKLRNSSWTLT